MRSEQINEIAAALAKAQAIIQPASKDKTNPHFKSKYADLASCWDACREAITSNGMSVVQTMAMRDKEIVLVTTLMHTSGQWIASEVPIIASKQDAQGYGSAITYFRRYSLCAMVGVAPEDDDGKAASQPYVKPAQQTRSYNAVADYDLPSETLLAPAPVAKISKDQVAMLNELIGEDMELGERIMEAYKLESLADLKQTSYTAVYSRCKKIADERRAACA